MIFTKIDFPYSPNITVINEEQFNVHMNLYEGYINKMNEIDLLLKQEDDLAQANSTYSKFRGIKRGETYALNGVILHELYFQNIGENDIQPGDMFIKYITQDFGSYENWEKQFIATAKASRGWVVLAYDWRSYRFRNISLDAHDIGNIVLSTPVLVLDMYEHAYFLEYANKKDEYIQNFMKNISWTIVDKRIYTNLLE
ncbi:MAG: Fe-Mn family superoxide dismutase [Lachnotalea sp.]